MRKRMKVLGRGHPCALRSMNNLVRLYVNKGKWEKTENLGKATVQDCKRALGIEHRITVSSLNNLADVYYCKKNWDRKKTRRYISGKFLKLMSKNGSVWLVSQKKM